MNNQPLNCENYEPLISAMIDGELESNERDELKSHLQNCVSCKQRVIAFECVDAAVETLSQDSLPNRTAEMDKLRLPSAVPFSMHLPTTAPRRAPSPLIWRLIPLAAAATLLICLAIAAWPYPKPASAEQISTAQIVEPMTELYRLNVQRQREQNLMLRTLDMDLRSMKLEINSLEPGSAERLSLAARIDTMLENVRMLETNYGERTD
jgi:anti-sigma factor RsiW